jgi:hypothetical protein
MKRNLILFAAVTALVLSTGLSRAQDGDDSGSKWGGGESGPVEPKRLIPVPDQPSEPLEIEVWMRGGGNRTYFPGDKVTVYFRTTRDAFVLLYDVDTEGRVHQIYPRSRWDEEFVQGGITYAVPGAGAGYRLMVTGPSGREDIVALASDRPISDRWDLCWGGLRTSNDYDDLAGVRLPMGRVGFNRPAGMDRVTQKLIEVPDDDDYTQTGIDHLSFRVGYRYADDGREGRDGGWRRGRSRSRW